MARILVVDDERDVAAMLKFMLEKDGHSVETAHNGREALVVLGVEPSDDAKAAPDLVIVDVMMPELDGHEVCARMFQEPHTRAIPVLMLTAKGSERETRGLSPNVVERLDKPFDPRALRARVADLLKEGKA